MSDGIFGTKSRLIVEAVVLRACPKCGASGVDEDEEQKPVGDHCPKCGTLRPEAEDRGVIYDTMWFTRWGKFKRQVKKFFRRK